MARYSRSAPLLIRLAFCASVGLAASPADLRALDDRNAAEIQGNVVSELFGNGLSCHLSHALIGAPAGGVGSAGAITIVEPVSQLPLQLLASPDQTAGAGFGSFISTIADVNGDAVEDVVVGAPGSQGTGQVFVFTGTLPAGLSSTPFRSFTGAGTQGRFGRSAVGVGDLTGDGSAEIAVSSRGISTANEGAVSIIDVAGSAVIFVIQGAADEDLGASIAGLRDINGDGIRDIVIGAPGANAGRGAIRIFSGANGGLLAAVNGNTDGQSFGESVSNVGDLNADGFDDILVGAPARRGAGGAGVGRARLISGGSLLQFPIQSLCDIRGTGFGDRFGANVSAISDITGDGVGEIVVTAPNTSDENADEDPSLPVEAGTAHVFRFSSEGCIPVAVLNGPARVSNKNLGVSVTSCIFNNDAFPDLMVGTRSDQNATDAGSVVFFYGGPPPPPPLSAVLDYRITRAGDFTGRLTYDSDPAGNCNQETFGRIDVANTSGTVFPITSSRAEAKVLEYTAFGLRPAAVQSCNRPALHLLVRTTCGATVFLSNVASRFINCGIGAPLPLPAWQADLLEVLELGVGVSVNGRDLREKRQRERRRKRRNLRVFRKQIAETRRYSRLQCRAS